MMYLNRVEMIGRLTADPELKTTTGKNSLCEFTLAVNFKGQNGNDDRAEFFTCEAWGGWAENLVKSARKGACVFVEGRLKQDRWRDQANDQKRSRIKVAVKRLFHFEPQYGRGGGAAEEGEKEMPF